MARFSTKPKTIVMCCSIPADVRAWLEVQADRSLAPMNTIIVQTLRTRMEAEARHEQAAPGADAA